MFKQLLAFAIMFLMSVSVMPAQTFEFRYQGQSLADGATVTIAAEMNDFDELACETNPIDNPGNGLILSVLSGSQNQGTAVMTINENSLNPARILWCMGGNCMMFGNDTSITKPFTVENGICQVQFDAQVIQNEGHLLATLTATIGNETHTVKIKFTNGEQEEPVTGDVNGDGFVTSADVTAIYDVLLGTDNQFESTADVNGDGFVTSADVTAVYDILLGN